MKKKYAFILMGADYDTEKNQVAFETEKMITYIYTVNNFDEAERKILELTEKGVGAVELCGAFGREKADRIIELTKNKIAVGYVIHNPEQDGLFEKFFGN